jgi:hypothetical protein
MVKTGLYELRWTNCQSWCVEVRWKEGASVQELLSELYTVLDSTRQDTGDAYSVPRQAARCLEGVRKPAEMHRSARE